jgi:hypothetical protein
MSTTTTNPALVDSVAYLLTKKAKHRAGSPFRQELVKFLRAPKGSYFFLSEDYYANTLIYTGDPQAPFKLEIDSAKPEIQARAQEINEELANL